VARQPHRGMQAEAVCIGAQRFPGLLLPARHRAHAESGYSSSDILRTQVGREYGGLAVYNRPPPDRPALRMGGMAVLLASSEALRSSGFLPAA